MHIYLYLKQLDLIKKHGDGIPTANIADFLGVLEARASKPQGI